MKVAGEDSGLFAGFKHNGTGAVTKQHTGGAVIPVKDAGKDLRPNHQRFFAGPGANELFSGGQGIHKTTANGLDVKRRATLNTEPGLQNTGTAGEHFVWCGGSNNNEVDILSADTGSVDCPPCRLLRQVHRGLAGQGDVTLLNACAFPDPLVRGFHPLFQVLVGHTVLRQIRTGSGNACKSHSACPQSGSVTVTSC